MMVFLTQNLHFSFIKLGSEHINAENSMYWSSHNPRQTFEVPNLLSTDTNTVL
jgi:hypothetical protein